MIKGFCVLRKKDKKICLSIIAAYFFTALNRKLWHWEPDERKKWYKNIRCILYPTIIIILIIRSDLSASSDRYLLTVSKYRFLSSLTNTEKRSYLSWKHRQWWRPFLRRHDKMINKWIFSLCINNKNIALSDNSLFQRDIHI